MELTTIYRSPEINQIMGALAKAQGGYKPLVANEDAPGGKFANLKAILLAVRESLSSNEIGFFQFIELLDEGSGASLLKTVLGHSSGQYIASCARIVPGETDRQTINIIEIHKRIHALMLLGIAPSECDPVAQDDNGEMLAEQHLIETLRKPDSPKKPEINRSQVIDKTQYNELMIILNGYEKIAKDIMESYGIDTIADLPASEYHKAQSRIREIRKTHEEYLRKK